MTRDVAGSAFQYAKIMTLPFFGSGIVELPPEGFKRAKNSRKMQMVFFVHEGKVLVTVGPPAIEQNGAAASDAETNEFAISKGGVWVVPRGTFLTVSFSPVCFSSQHPLVLQATLSATPHGRHSFNRIAKEERSASSASSSLIIQRRPVGSGVCDQPSE